MVSESDNIRLEIQVNVLGKALVRGVFRTGYTRRFRSSTWADILVKIRWLGAYQILRIETKVVEILKLGTEQGKYHRHVTK